MRRIKVNRFLQDPCLCAVAASAMMANYYNPEIDYEYAKKLALKKFSKRISEEGLDSGQICLLLNYLGFNKVTLICSNIDLFDYSWENFSKKKMKKVLEKSISNKKDSDERLLIKNIYKWYTTKSYNNIIKISYNFGKEIRESINKKQPVLVTFNWTMLMKFAKEGDNGPDPINGEGEEHAVVVNGYDSKGAWVVDSHHQYYKYRLKKYRKGLYKIPWEQFFSCVGQGDIILAEDYISN
jgi:hypothetical protein